MIGCAFAAPNKLGAEFLEKVHENTLANEMCATGLAVAQPRNIRVHYDDDVVVGECFADRLVEDLLLVASKTVTALDDTQMSPGARPGGRMQCAKYLKASGLQFCRLLNFGRSYLKNKRMTHGR